MSGAGLKWSEAVDVAESPKEANAMALFLLARIADALDRLAHCCCDTDDEDELKRKLAKAAIRARRARR